jgi:hypothetical protein
VSGRASALPRNLIRRHQVSDHQRRFGDTALPRSAARRTRERGNSGAESEPVFRESNEPFENSRIQDVPVYIEGPSPSYIRSAQIPGSAPWNLSTCNQSWLMWQSMCDRINQ